MFSTTLPEPCGRYEEALILGQEIVINENGNAHIFGILGNCAYEMRKDDLAQKYYDDARQAEESDADAYRYMGRFYLNALKKKSLAIKTCAIAVDLDPDDCRNHLELAIIYAENNDNKEAKEYFNRALEILQQLSEERDLNPCGHCNMGECYLGLSQWEEAKSHFQRAVEEAKNYPHCPARRCHVSLFGLARLYELVGDYKQALSYYDYAVEIIPKREYVEKRQAFLDKHSGTGKGKGFWGLFNFFKRKKT